MKKSYIILPPDKEFFFTEFFNNKYRVDYSFEKIKEKLDCFIISSKEEREKIIAESNDYDGANSYLCLFSPKTSDRINFLWHYVHNVNNDKEMNNAWIDFIYYNECQDIHILTDI